jgi:hypothetical protein
VGDDGGHRLSVQFGPALDAQLVEPKRSGGVQHGIEILFSQTMARGVGVTHADPDDDATIGSEDALELVQTLCK